MNYRHGFHAGNFADVLKHIVLTRVLLHLATKPAPFRVIDTHAGRGLYDLGSEEARRGGEWQNGIGRLLAAQPAKRDGLAEDVRAAGHGDRNPVLAVRDRSADDYDAPDRSAPGQSGSDDRVRGRLADNHNADGRIIDDRSAGDRSTNNYVARDRAQDRGQDRAQDRDSDRAQDRTPDRAQDRGPDRAQDRGPDRAQDHVQDHSASALIAPYLDAVRAFNADAPAGTVLHYPGSPALALHLMRAQDRLAVCERHPEEAARLRGLLRGERRARFIDSDGWSAPAALLPPAERRGVVLIDPPFEQPDEFARLAAALAAGWRKWPTGLFIGWYPVKRLSDPVPMLRTLREAGVPKILRIEWQIDAIRPDGPLVATGLVLINPPWRLDDDLAQILPYLLSLLRRSNAAAHRLDRIAGEN